MVWAKNHGNRVVRGVEKATRKDGSYVEYIDSGDCEARRLRGKGMAHIVRDEGWRLCGFETTDIDPIWANLDRVRTFYRALRNYLWNPLKYIREREAYELNKAKSSPLQAFFTRIKGNGLFLH